MGYYTDYELTILNATHEQHDEIWDYIEDNHDDFYGIDRHGDNDSCTWYEHDANMLNLSKRFPDFVFSLYGEGEESRDVWYTYYKNGKMQDCPAIITFEQYDESKLK